MTLAIPTCRAHSLTHTPLMQAVMNVALDTNFAIPGDATFPLNQAFEPPRDRNEAEVLRQYISQMRQELAVRLLNRIYADGNVPSKVRAITRLPCSTTCIVHCSHSKNYSGGSASPSESSWERLCERRVYCTVCIRNWSNALVGRTSWKPKRVGLFNRLGGHNLGSGRRNKWIASPRSVL